MRMLARTALAAPLVAVAFAAGAQVPAVASVATDVVTWGGVEGDVPVAADYTGDGRTDIAIYRPSTGKWYVHGATEPVQWGGYESDQPVPADYDGDGKTDFAVVRQGSDGALYWYIRYSAGGTETIRWGVANPIDGTDRPVPGDYDGDGRAEPAVIRTESGGDGIQTYWSRHWYIRGSSGAVEWGGGMVTSDEEIHDALVPADYNGDGRTDIAYLEKYVRHVANDPEMIFWTWHIRGLSTIRWGSDDDFVDPTPVPARYTGQSHDILAYFDAPTGMWHVRSHYSVHWGQEGDVPQVGDYRGNHKADQVVYRPSTGEWWLRWEN